MFTAWKTFTEALGLAPVSTAPWALPLVWPSSPVEGAERLRKIEHWPLGFEDVSAQWGSPLSAQPAAVGKAVEALRHGHLERDWLNALGALAVVSEFWRIHQALERYQARAASIHVQSVAMLPHDYRWDVRLHGANAQADRELNGRWSALKQKWRSGLGKAEEPARPGLSHSFPGRMAGRRHQTVVGALAQPTPGGRGLRAGHPSRCAVGGPGWNVVWKRLPEAVAPAPPGPNAGRHCRARPPSSDVMPDPGFCTNMR